MVQVKGRLVYRDGALVARVGKLTAPMYAVLEKIAAHEATGAMGCLVDFVPPAQARALERRGLITFRHEAWCLTDAGRALLKAVTP